MEFDVDLNVEHPITGICEICGATTKYECRTLTGYNIKAHWCQDCNEGVIEPNDRNNPVSNPADRFDNIRELDKRITDAERHALYKKDRNVDIKD